MKTVAIFNIVGGTGRKRPPQPAGNVGAESGTDDGLKNEIEPR
jgi:hypothetical protein